jgi:hypothetical protein
MLLSTACFEEGQGGFVTQGNSYFLLKCFLLMILLERMMMIEEKWEV